MNLNKQKGSILAYALIILAIMLSVVAAMSVTTVMEKKSASSSEFSTQAYQTADSGIQIAIKKINSVLTAGVGANSIETAFGPGSCNVNAGVAQVTGGSELGLGGNNAYTLTFFDNTGAAISDCTESIMSIASVKSVGAFHDTVRAVNVAMSAIDSNTKLLIHADDQNAVFNDSSTNPKTISSNGGVSHSNTVFKFTSGKSASFNGTSSYLNVASSSDFDFGTNDFTIDFWEKNTSTSTSRQHALSFGQYGVKNLEFDFNDTVGIWVYWNGNGSSNKISAGAMNAYTDGNWHHIALVRSGDVMTLYVDGSSVGSTNYTGLINLSGATTYYIGANSTNNFFWNGYIDELRISKGVARWTDNFAPATVPYR